MRLYDIDHVQLDMPAGEEAHARDFYAGVLGLAEIAKPPELAKRGGAWFSNGAVTVHLGAVAVYHAPLKAHPAFLVEGLGELITHLEQAGHPISRDVPIPGYDRVHAFDPFGNRIELMERTGKEME